MSYFPNALSYGNNTAIDAFGRARVSTPETEFENGFQYGTGSLEWETILVGGGSLTHLPNQSAISLAVSTGATDMCRRQTRAYHRYQPGKSLNIFTTFLFGAPVTNTTRRIGYFTDENGMFFEQTGDGTLNFVRRSFASGAITRNAVSQSSWNIDKLDGTGPSGITLDITKAQILWFDLQWLGEGRIRCGFDIGGVSILCHEFLIANVLSEVSMTSGNNPIRCEIFNTGASAGGTLTQVCSTVISEGGFQTFGLPCTAGNTTGSISVTTRRPIMSIRPKSTINGITNRANIIPNKLDLLVGTNNIFWEVVYSGSLTGASWASVSGESHCEFDVAATAISGGLVIDSGYAVVGLGSVKDASSHDFTYSKKIPITLDASGSNPINYTIVATSLTSTATVNASLKWDEQH